MDAREGTDKEVESTFPATCNECGGRFVFATGRTYAVYSCGSEHRSKGWAHTLACKDLCQLRADLEAVRKERDEVKAKYLAAVGQLDIAKNYFAACAESVRSTRASNEGKGHHCMYRQCADSMYDHSQAALRFVGEYNPYGQLLKERDKARADLAAARQRIEVLEGALRVMAFQCDGNRVSQPIPSELRATALKALSTQSEATDEKGEA